ncbi:glycosyltransferase family protein [Cupriavidus necator]|uniref:glycosyltransferase family protein n=1 Tax=Cupriavidus necator TaxID=106590 RepID=UPI003F73244F
MFVANNFIPTLQLSFIKPLAPMVNSGDMAVDVVSEAQLTEVYGERRWQKGARKWMKKRFDAFDPTLIVFCRYSGPHGDVLRDLARASGVPVVYHIDDDLLNVPRELGPAKFAMHNDPKRLATVSRLLGDVDLVYLSTEPLRQRMAQHIGGEALAGKVYCTTDSLVPPPDARDEVRVGYMGFDHAHDFEIVVPALAQLMKNYPAVRFELFGSIPKPAALDQFGDRVVTHAPVPGYEKFMAKFASLDWNIGICPLADTPFNAVKANTKWVEYTSVGAAVLATGGTIYDDCCADGCGVLVRRPEDWYPALAELVESAEKRSALVAAAQARARQDYSLVSLRHQVLDVFARAKCITPASRS